MFAVIKTGGKQYKVAKDDVITVERLAGEAGGSVSFEQVLMLGGDETKVGAPVIEGASVSGEIVEQTRGDKIIVFKKKRRQNYRRKKGHRQDLTVVRITDILGSGKPKRAAKSKAKPKAKAEKPAEEAATNDAAAEAAGAEE